MSPTREQIFKEMEKYRNIIEPDNKGWKCLEIGTDGDEYPSGNYKYFGKGNTWKTMDYLPRLNPDIVADISNNNLPSNEWDLVICSQVLEHVFNVQKAIKEIMRITKPGGYFIIDNPWGVGYHGTDDYGDYWRMSLQCMVRLIGKNKPIEGTQTDNLVILLARKQ